MSVPDDEMTVPTYDVDPTPVVRGPRIGILATPNRAAQLGIGNSVNARAARLGIGSALGSRAARLGLTNDSALTAAPDDTEKSA